MLCLALPALAVGGGACGDDDDGSESDRSTGQQVFTGVFEIVDDELETGPVSGRAELSVSDVGTSAEIRLADLEPNTAYSAYLHARSCAQPDPGGPRLPLASGDSGQPAHLDLSFRSNADGEGFAEATDDRVVPDPSSRSIVLQREIANGNRAAIACAQFG